MRGGNSAHFWGMMSKDGVVVRALASHQCGRVRVRRLSSLLVLVLAPRGFSPGTPVFPSPQKPTFPNSNSIWDLRATGGFVSHNRLLSATLLKQTKLIYLYMYKATEKKRLISEKKREIMLPLWSHKVPARVFVPLSPLLSQPSVVPAKKK